MRALSGVSVGLTLISGFLLLALVAEVYYLLWWKKKKPNREIAGGDCKNREEMLDSPVDGRDKDLLVPFGPPRSLFTIREETNDDDLESESRKSSKRRSLSTQISTPLSSPPLFAPPSPPLDRKCPLFGSGTAGSSLASPPPKFKFLRDAEEKLYKETMREEAMRVQKISEKITPPPPSKGLEEGDGSLIAVLVGKNNSSSSQVNPLLPSPPTTNESGHGKLISYLSSSES